MMHAFFSLPLFDILLGLGFLASGCFCIGVMFYIVLTA